jgi:hypothetical protein
MSANSVGTTYQADDQAWDNTAYLGNILTVNSAGNLRYDATGALIADSRYVGSPAKALNTVSVGNYVDATNTINSGSSWLNPSDIHNDKPELSAPGTDIDAGGYTFTGTSQAAPHVAGMAAGLLTAYPETDYRPWYAKAWLMLGAQDGISGGFDSVGVGGADYEWMYYDTYFFSQGHAWTYEGPHSYIAEYDAADGTVDNVIQAAITLQSSYSRVNAVLVWFLNGDYTVAHRTNPQVLGLDLDLVVTNPNGVSVGSSGSFNNSFERVSFDPTLTGTYKFKIVVHSNDANEGIYAALIIHWW